MRESFVFYRSFYESAKHLPLEDQCEVYNAIMEYALNGNLPTKLSAIANSIFILIKPQIDKNNKRYENGKNGGRPVVSGDKQKPNHNQTITNIEPNDNVNDIKKESTNVELKKDELSSHVDFSMLMDYFNSTFSGKLPSIKSMTETRKKAIKGRVSQYGKKSIEEVFKLVLTSDFLLGGNDRNWRPDFDWIFKASNYTKILEGNYNGKRNNTMSKRESVSRLKDLSEAILCGSASKED